MYEGAGGLRWRSPLHTFVDVLEDIVTDALTTAHSGKKADQCNLELRNRHLFVEPRFSSVRGFSVSYAQSVGLHRQSMLPEGKFQELILQTSLNFLLKSCQVAFWNSFGVINVITEGILVMLPVLIVWNLQMPLLRKLLIIWCFAVRIL